MLISRALKHLWEDCFELDAYLRFNTAQKIYKLDMEAFPDDVIKLGHYLELSIDVGPAMTTKILTENGQVLHRSTYRSLTTEEGCRAREYPTV